MTARTTAGMDFVQKHGHMNSNLRKTTVLFILSGAALFFFKELFGLNIVLILKL